jgi:hypothetical protein
MSKIEVDAIDKQSGSTLTLGGSGTAVTLACGATQSGFGRTGTVDWQTTPKTATFTAANGEGYFINSGSALTANLPAGSAGAIVAFSDYARNFATYNFTINPNGSEKIGGVADDLVLDVNGQAITLVYVDSTKGWINVQNAEDTEVGLVPAYVAATVSGSGNTLTTSGDYKIAIFTGPGTFCVSNAGNARGSNSVTGMIVAGGAGGGARSSGGGGAGGLTVGQSIPVSATGFPIVVGGGGAKAPGPCAGSTAGSNSTGLTFVGLGGGAAGSQGPAPIGQPGGSGGGAATGGVGPLPGPNAGGSATQPAQPQPGQSVFNAGSAGGSGSANPGPDFGGGGGGGATAVGQPSEAPTPTMADGGAGKDVTPFFNLSPSLPNSGVYAGGGGGGIGQPAPGRGGAAGPGGGGAGGFNGTVGSDATTNTGGGGGGGTGVPGPGGNGGSGIVIIEYKFQN